MKKYFIISLCFVLCLVVIFAVIGSVFGLLYPLKFKQEIKVYAQEFFLPPALVASVINVESGFKSDEVSSAGAIGLMQIMPSTAIEIAQKLKVENFHVKQLYEPKINIRFGCYYLRYLLDFYNDDLNNALASYNAGLTNVNSWLLDSLYSDDGETLKIIPFKETNDFVKKVKKNIKVYERKIR